MTDLRSRISGVVLNRLADYGIRIDREIADSVAEAVLAMPGAATVELPTARLGPLTWPQTFTPHELAPAEMRYFAGKLLAAAIAAEVGQ